MGGIGRCSPTRLALLVSLLFGLVSVAPVKAGGLDEVVPDSALFFLSVRNPPELRQKLSSLPLHQLYHQRDVQAFLAEPAAAAMTALRRREGGLASLTSGLESLFIQTLDFCTGEAVFFVLAEDLNLTEECVPHVAIVASIDGKGEETQAFFEQLRQQAASEGAQERQHDFASVTIFEITPAPVRTEKAGEEELLVGGAEPQTKPGQLGPLYYCLTDHHFLIASRLELVQELLFGLTHEPSGGLAAQPDYRATRRACGEQADLFAYLNVSALLGLLEQSTEEDSAGTSHGLRGLDLDGVRALGVAVGVEPGLQGEAGTLQLSFYLHPPSAPPRTPGCGGTSPPLPAE